MAFYKRASTKGPRPAITENDMTQSKLSEARLLIAALSDTDKLTLLGEQLEGPLAFEGQDALDAMCEVVDAYYVSFNHIEEAIADSLIEQSDDYDGGRFDYLTSRGV
jgi:hypothetical protein